MGLPYSKKDLSNIAAFLCGRDCKTISSEFSLPQELVLTEETLYLFTKHAELFSSDIKETND